MPVKLYLQVIGQTQKIPGLEDCLADDLTIRQLPVAIKYLLLFLLHSPPKPSCTCMHYARMQLPFRGCAHPLVVVVVVVVVSALRSALFHRRVFSRRLNDLLDVLRKLKLVGCQEEVPPHPLPYWGHDSTHAARELIFSLHGADHTTHGATRHTTRW